ncbi:MAG: hypothetical protein F6K41_06890 [Symploca sp. SIO3E6]|nr:hypothetical protein [Caldora sp. SIO3E6]
MSVHIHEVNEGRHERFLREGRRDPFTKETLKHGDRVVFCARCKSAFLESSWEAMRGRHCDQTETLAEFPHTPRLGDTTKLERKIKDLTAEITNRKGKIQIITTFCYLLTAGIAGLGYFAYDQYQNIDNLQRLNFDTQSKIDDLEKERSEVEETISAFNKKITLNNCQKNKLNPIDVENKVASLGKKIDCLLQERDSYKEQRDTYEDQRNTYKDQRDTYKNTLNGYPYSIPDNSDVKYRGYLSQMNNRDNPVHYRLYVPNGSRFNIYLKDMEANGDFEIIDSSGNYVKNSKRTNSGSDELRNFYLSSGYYDIKIWNQSTDRSTYFTLRIYRQ